MLRAPRLAAHVHPRSAPFIRFVTAACNTTSLIVKSFGSIILDSINAPRTNFVDISREERCGGGGLVGCFFRPMVGQFLRHCCRLPRSFLATHPSVDMKSAAAATSPCPSSRRLSRRGVPSEESLGALCAKRKRRWSPFRSFVVVSVQHSVFVSLDRIPIIKERARRAP